MGIFRGTTCECGRNGLTDLKNINIGSIRKKKMVLSYKCPGCEERFYQKQVKKDGTLHLFKVIEKEGGYECEFVKELPPEKKEEENAPVEGAKGKGRRMDEKSPRGDGNRSWEIRDSMD